MPVPGTDEELAMIRVESLKRFLVCHVEPFDLSGQALRNISGYDVNAGEKINSEILLPRLRDQNDNAG